MQNIWQIWQNFDPRMIIMAVVGSMFALAFVIHLLLFISPSFNWLGSSEPLPAAAAQMIPLPQLGKR
jgi:hypothetical protein